MIYDAKGYEMKKIVYCRDDVVGLSDGREVRFYQRVEKDFENTMTRIFNSSNRIAEVVNGTPKYYFYVNELGEVVKKKHTGDVFDAMAKTFGNFFTTRKKAENQAEHLVELFGLAEYYEENRFNFDRR